MKSHKYAIHIYCTNNLSKRYKFGDKLIFYFLQWHKTHVLLIKNNNNVRYSRTFSLKHTNEFSQRTRYPHDSCAFVMVKP